MPAGTFKFLMVGKYEHRKGYEPLLEAFDLAFRDRPGVELYLKPLSLFGRSAELPLRAALEQRGLSNVKIIDACVDEPTTAALYRSCDCFVFPSMGEGWGLAPDRGDGMRPSCHHPLR